MRISRLLPLAGILLFIYVISNTNISGILGTLAGVDVPLLLVFLLLFIPNILLKCLKWNVLIRSCGIDYPLWKTFTSWIVGFSIGMITPGRLGDLSRAYYLKEKAAFGNALSTVVVDRVLDIIVLFCLSLAGLSIFLSIYAGHENLSMVIGALFVAFLALCALLTRRGLVRSVLRPPFRRIVPGSHRAKISALFNDFYTGIDLMKGSKKSLLLSMALSLLAWLTFTLQCYVLALALGMNALTYQFLLFVMPVSTVITTLPVSFAGIGTRDMTLIFFFSFVSLSAESAVSFSLMELFSSYLIALFGLFFWLRNPMKMRTGAEAGRRYSDILIKRGK